MSQYEYAAVPAPRQVPKVKGIKAAEERFAQGITEMLNTWAAEGWEFVRAETLGFEEKSGFLGKGTSGQTMLLIFRRAIASGADEAGDPSGDATASTERAHRMREPREAAAVAPLPPVSPPQEAPARSSGLPPLSARRDAGKPGGTKIAPAADPAGRPRRG